VLEDGVRIVQEVLLDLGAQETLVLVLLLVFVGGRGWERW
jgi:hypothetical protein